MGLKKTKEHISKNGRAIAIAQWSWWWVFSPIWIPLALVGVIAMIVGMVVIVQHKNKK